MSTSVFTVSFSSDKNQSDLHELSPAALFSLLLPAICSLLLSFLLPFLLSFLPSFFPYVLSLVYFYFFPFSLVPCLSSILPFVQFLSLSFLPSLLPFADFLISILSAQLLPPLFFSFLSFLPPFLPSFWSFFLSSLSFCFSPSCPLLFLFCIYFALPSLPSVPFSLLSSVPYLFLFLVSSSLSLPPPRISFFPSFSCICLHLPSFFSFLALSICSP